MAAPEDPFPIQAEKNKYSLPEAAVYSHHKLHFFLESGGISVYEFQNPMSWLVPSFEVQEKSVWKLQYCQNASEL